MRNVAHEHGPAADVEHDEELEDVESGQQRRVERAQPSAEPSVRHRAHMQITTRKCHRMFCFTHQLALQVFTKS